MMINEILSEYNICALVGPNSQGKTTILQKFKSDNSILISNEVKANEYIKNSVSNSPLIQWLEKMLDINIIQEKINEQLQQINLDSINNITNVKLSLSSSPKDYKGLVNVDIQTSSNDWNSPGSGETFIAELLLIKEMLNPTIKNPVELLIIDEPETFLHPSLFIKVCSILSDISKYTKILVATHSPLFLNYLVSDLGSIVYVEKGVQKQLPSTGECIKLIEEISFYKKIYSISDIDLDGVKSCYKHIRKYLEIIDKYFDVFLKPKIIQGLFAKIIIIGEGRSEKVLFDCFKKEYCGEKYIGDVEFVDLYGKEFMLLYEKIMSNIGIKPIIIFDRDENKSDEYNRSISDELDKLLSLSFDIDIEDYLEFGDKEKRKSRDFKTTDSPIIIYSLYSERNTKLLSLLAKIDRLIMNEMQ